jgi:hypothetical protein
MTPEERMQQFNDACAYFGRPDIQAFGVHPVDTDRLFISGKDMDKPETRAVVWRATFLVRDGDVRSCFRCYVHPESVLTSANDCLHPKVWVPLDADK